VLSFLKEAWSWTSCTCLGVREINPEAFQFSAIGISADADSHCQIRPSVMSPAGGRSR
jgi:hypothetical protein